MKTKTTLLKGLAIDLMIEEVHHEARSGALICYIASIYVVPRGRGKKDKMLARKSRLVGAAEALKAEIRRDGLKAFDKYVDLCSNVHMNK